MTVVYLLSGTSWTVPSDWNSANNSVETIGGGGGGTAGGSGGGGGGGGGAYSKITNLALTIGNSVTIQVGSGGTGGVGGAGTAGGDTWFNGSTLALSSVGSKGGGFSTGGVAALGGAATSGIGTTKFNGGNGGTPPSVSNGGSGGGGAGGPNGAGGKGGLSGPGASNSADAGSGGGGNGANSTSGGASGVDVPTNGPDPQVGTAGGAAQDTTAGGAGGAATTPTGTAGSPGSHGSGGGGGSGVHTAGTPGQGGAGGNGGNGVEFDLTHGSGGGGGGAGGASGTSGTGTGTNGGAGGNYGGGGGGGSATTGTNGNGGAGAPGIIVIIYLPILIYWPEDSPRVVRAPSWRSKTHRAYDDIGPVVRTLYGYDDQPVRTSRRSLWSPRARPSDNEGLPFTATVTPTAYYEEEIHKQHRRPWNTPIQPDSDFVIPVPSPWGFEEETHRFERRPIHLNQTTPDEFINNPTQVVFAKWGFDEEQHRIERLPIHLRQTSPDEFIRNPTQTIFVPWGFDEEGHRLERAVPHRFPQADVEGLPFTAATPTTYYEEEPHRQVRRLVHLYQTQPDEFIFNPTQVRFVSWGFEEEQHRIERRLVHLNQTTPDEFINNPTQAAFVAWGYEEEQHRQERRIFHRLVQQDDPLGLGQLVGAPWGFDEEQHRLQRRLVHLNQTSPDEFIFNPTQTVFVNWGFDEGRPPSRRIVAIRSQPQIEGLPFTAAALTVWTEPEFARLFPRRQWRRLLGEDLLIPTTPAGFTIWGFEEETHRLSRRQIHLYQTAPDEFIFNPTQIAFVGWGFDEEQHRLQRQIVHLRQTSPDEFLNNPTQFAFVPWGFDEEQHRLQRRLVHLNLTDPNEFIFNPTQVVFTSWGFDEDRSPSRRILTRNRVQLDIEGLPFTFAGLTIWVEPETLRTRRRSLHLRPRQQDDFLTSVQSAFVPWWTDEAQRLSRRPLWRNVAEEVFGFAGPSVTTTPWGWETDRLTFRPRGSIRLDLVDDIVFLPIIPPPPIPVFTPPNGRWNVLDPTPLTNSFLFSQTIMSPRLGEIGFTLFIRARYANFARAFVFTKPSGATLTVYPFLVYRTDIGPLPLLTPAFLYTFGPGDLDEIGRWRVYVDYYGPASNVMYFDVVPQQ